MSLALFLREELELRGTKIGCGNGECGACTIILDDQAVCSCLVPLGRTAGRQIETIESLGSPDDLHPLQSKLVEYGAFQCGFCTPGVLMSLVALLRVTPKPTNAEIRVALQGNLCRCTGYVKLLEAIGEIVREGSYGR
ncbi:MAG: (2Fe-2S)-binding protein [Hyphomicrobiaceae bacterium]